jgi:hypothetical protein
MSEAIAQGAGLIPDYLPEHVQFLMLVIQGLLTVVVAGVAWFLRSLFGAVRDLQKELSDLHKDLLKNYATKNELSDRVHGLRDTIGVHNTWLHLISYKIDMKLPESNDRRTRNDP